MATGVLKHRARRAPRHAAHHGASDVAGDIEIYCVSARADGSLPVDVSHAGRSIWGPDCRCERLGKDSLSLELVTGGSGILEVNGVRHVLAPGEMFLLHPSDHCEYYTGEARRWSKLYVVFHTSSTIDIVRRLGLDHILHIRLASTVSGRARRLFKELLFLARTRPYGFREQISGIAYGLLLIAARDAVVVRGIDRYPVYVRKAILHAEAHVGEALTAAQLARVAGCARQYLSTLFSTHVGMGLHEWLTRCRIQHARFLLETTDCSIAAAARASGYHDQLHFSRVFKRLVGVSPSAYSHSPRANRPVSGRRD